MEARVPARLTPAEGRHFGLVVGGAFLVLAAVSAWRGHVIPPRILGAIGGLLVLGGLLVPAAMGPVRAGWMALAHAISRVTTPLFMGMVYYVVVTPMGFVRRRLGGNPMRNKENGGSYWVAHPAPPNPQDMQRQF